MLHKERTNHNPSLSPLTDQHVKDVDIASQTSQSNSQAPSPTNDSRPAPSIVQQVLTPGAVVFSFPSTCFSSSQAAYRVIQDQIGALDGAKCISMYSTKPTKDLNIETLFQNPTHAILAVNEGMIVADMVYHASSSDAGDLASLTRVQLNFLNIPVGATLVSSLIQSFRYYGKVYQVKKFTTDGFFEGLVSVIVDNTGTYEDDERRQVPVKPLSGAPPVCYYCRQAGHIKSKWSAKTRHKNSTAFGQLLDDYEEDTQLDQKRKDKTLEKEPLTIQAPDKTQHTEQDIILKGDLYRAFMPKTKKVDEVHYMGGTAASQWASEEISSRMAVDKHPDDQDDDVMDTQDSILIELRKQESEINSTSAESQPQQQKEFLSFIKSRLLHLDILCIQETSSFHHQDHLTEDQIHRFTSFLFPRCTSIVTKYCAIVCLLPDLALDASCVSLDERCIVASVLDSNRQLLCRIANLYVLAQASDRPTFFSFLLNLPFFAESEMDTAWLFTDDLDINLHSQ
ncbi:unnamed protein product [Rhizopus stolonifer]